MAKSIEKRVEELEKIVKKLQEEKNKKLRKELAVGDDFSLAGIRWKILDITEQGYKCIAEKLPENMKFGSNNDWKESNIRKYLNEDFYEKLVEEIGEENIIPFERNLFSLDGQTEYGNCEDKVSIISMDEYRQYRELLPNEDYYWWTLTPDSTKCNGDTSWLRVVCPSGRIGSDGCNYCIGVRPFCIFSSTIFESGE